MKLNKNEALVIKELVDHALGKKQHNIMPMDLEAMSVDLKKKIDRKGVVHFYFYTSFSFDQTTLTYDDRFPTHYRITSRTVIRDAYYQGVCGAVKAHNGYPNFNEHHNYMWVGSTGGAFSNVYNEITCKRCLAYLKKQGIEVSTNVVAEIRDVKHRTRAITFEL